MAVSEPNNVPDCTCGLLQRLADDTNCSVEFDPITNSFGLRSRDDHWFTPIRYCFQCGGKVPDRSSELFEVASPDEEQDLLSILQRCSNIDDVVTALGSPDRVVAPNEVEIGAFGSRTSSKPVDGYYQYLRRWKTIDATVLRYSDGTIDFCWSQKLKRDRVIDLAKRIHPG